MKPTCVRTAVGSVSDVLKLLVHCWFIKEQLDLEKGRYIHTRLSCSATEPGLLQSV